MAIDKVFVRSIRVPASIGTLAWEKQVDQIVEVDVVAHVDTARLLATGDLNEGIDFRVVYNTVHQVVSKGHVTLVELLADQIAVELLRVTNALTIELEIRKYSAEARNAQCMGVNLTRCRDQLFCDTPDNLRQA